MVFGTIQSDELVNKLEKIKSFLNRKKASEVSYTKLINLLEAKINYLKQNSKLNIKLVSTYPDSVLKLKFRSESNQQLRSLYDFKAISPIEDIAEILQSCNAILLIIQSNEVINKHQQKIIDLARKRNISLSILVEKDNNQDASINFQEYITSSGYLNLRRSSSLHDSFFDLDNDEHVELYQNMLINSANILHKKSIKKHIQEIYREINLFFEQEDDLTWRKINKIKQDYLHRKEVPLYQQHVLNKTFNKINQQQQQKILYIKQTINHAKGSLLNPFLSESWFFELQQIIERSQVKLVKEKSETYLYLTVENSGRLEYIHNYILDLYQQKVSDYLKLQWSNINYLYEEGGLSSFTNNVNQNIPTIEIFKDVDKKLVKIAFNPEPVPELNLTKILDTDCLKLNSRLIFDYNYTQSTWFKLFISVLLGITIYLVTKLYFGDGRYIGFFILFFQIINIITGQSIKKIKLKNHKKELQRMIGHKYQTLARLIVEQMIQTLIVSLDKKNRQYQAKINAIAEIAQQEMNKIEHKISRYQSRKNKLKNHRQKIIVWLDEIKA